MKKVLLLSLLLPLASFNIQAACAPGVAGAYWCCFGTAMGCFLGYSRGKTDGAREAEECAFSNSLLDTPQRISMHRNPNDKTKGPAEVAIDLSDELSDNNSRRRLDPTQRPKDD